MHEITLLGYHETVIPECFILKHIMTWGQILKNSCAQLLHLAPNFLTAFSSNEVERKKHFLALNFFYQKKQSKSWAPGAIVECKNQEIDPWWNKPFKSQNYEELIKL